VIKPYQILIDMWEGNPDVDASVLLSQDVVGCVVRLNSMSGGHHKDERFEQNWALAKLFPVQTIYFVYNPWVSGQQNYLWLMTHLPADFGKRRILVDIEVKYPDYSPDVYAAEVAAFINLVNQAGYQIGIYTGGWFLSVLSKWPTNQDYWWGAYSTILTECEDWASYKKSLDAISMSAFTKLSPGPVRMWQCTGDGVRLEGFGGHAVDVNVFPGELTDLSEWFSMPDTTTDPDPLPDQTVADGVVITTNSLNIRVNSGLSSAILGQLFPGAVVSLGEMQASSDGQTIWTEVTIRGYVAERWQGNTYVRRSVDA
jgi:GH25 family lysozyme M1 (1,4-beta-N-acetylmuramidase)